MSNTDRQVTQDSPLKQRNVRGSNDKFLTFMLAGEHYGIRLGVIQEIIRIMDITPVPHVPDYIRGVINLRGKVLPVITLRRKFAMEPAEDNKRTCIIVVQVEHNDETLTMGLIVDAVNEVQNIPQDHIEPPPSFGDDDLSEDFLEGVGKIDKRVVMLLNIDRVLTAQHVIEITNLTSSFAKSENAD